MVIITFLAMDRGRLQLDHRLGGPEDLRDGPLQLVHVVGVVVTSLTLMIKG